MLALFKALPLAQKIGIGMLVLVFIVTAIAIGNHFIDRAFDSAEGHGATKSAAQAAEKGLSNVESANRAAERVSRNPVVRDADCLRHSRTPENC